MADKVEASKDDKKPDAKMDKKADKKEDKKSDAKKEDKKSDKKDDKKSRARWTMVRTRSKQPITVAKDLLVVHSDACFGSSPSHLPLGVNRRCT